MIFSNASETRVNVRLIEAAVNAVFDLEFHPAIRAANGSHSPGGTTSIPGVVAVKAIAVVRGHRNSVVAMAAYTIGPL